EFMLMSEAQEKAMGAQSDPAIVAQYGLYQDDKLQAFIDEKGQQMAAISHRPNLDYSFKIMDSPVVNAFAVPGGYVYFTRGILAHFNNEAEFAGVLGHEIGHVTARHSAKQYSKQMLAQVGFIAGVIVSPTFRELSDVAQQGLGLLFLKFGRDAETQSDKLGVEYSTKIGYDAHEMANFFQTINRLQKAAGAEIPDFLSTHPNPVNRYNNVHQLADQWQSQLNKQNLDVNRNKYLRMIDGLIYGEDPRQGYVEDDRFYHPELKFTFPIPRGWKTANSPSAFQMGEPNGKAMMVLTLAQQQSLDEAANAFITDNKLKLINSKRVNVNGNNAIALLAQ
ncbi:MAG: M48 family metalloprotease, partial [Bacteroidota bacterium]